MKITNRKENYIEVQDLVTGECFELNSRYFIATDHLMLEEGTRVCVGLSTGVVNYIDVDELVSVVDAELVIG